MKVLFVSHLHNDVSAGLSWSVPASVDSLSKIDDVLWVNTTGEIMPHWEKVKSFYSLDKKDKLTLTKVPKSFGNPDVVFFEGMYDSFKEIVFAKELRSKGIPYIIVPRGSLTYKALHDYSRIKKIIAHRLFYDKYIDGAIAIQYLTNKEYEDSKFRYGKSYFILPNGFYKPTRIKDTFSSGGIKALYIGRIDIVHKGLDIIIDACRIAKESLLESGFTLSLYGPQTKDWYVIQNTVKKESLENIITLKGTISGREKEDAILSSDVFIMASRFEGHPMGLIEALAYGLPCVVTPGTNMMEKIEDAGAGWICECTAESLASTLVRMTGEKDQLPVVSKKALDLACKYDWDELAKTLHGKLKELI